MFNFFKKKDSRCLSDAQLKEIFDSISELTSEIIKAININNEQLDNLTARLLKIENNSKKP